MILFLSLFPFFFTSAPWGGTGRQKGAVVSLIPENLFCRKTCRCVQDGEGAAALMTQPALHTEGQRVTGNERLLPLSFPFPMSPFSALVKDTRCCSGPDLITFTELLEGRSPPAFPAPRDSAVVSNSLCLAAGLVSTGGFGGDKGDACSCQRADIEGPCMQRHPGVREATSAGNFL